MGEFVKGQAGTTSPTVVGVAVPLVDRPVSGGGERVVLDASVTLIFAGWIPQDGVSAGVLLLV